MASERAPSSANALNTERRAISKNQGERYPSPSEYQLDYKKCQVADSRIEKRAPKRAATLSLQNKKAKRREQKMGGANPNFDGRSAPRFADQDRCTKPVKRRLESITIVRWTARCEQG